MYLLYTIAEVAGLLINQLKPEVQMARIKLSQLEGAVEWLNKITGSPPVTWSSSGRANIGNYHIDFGNGGVALERIITEQGGVDRIVDRTTGPDLYEKIYVFIDGYREGVKSREVGNG
jgi:hypothetical protein